MKRKILAGAVALAVGLLATGAGTAHAANTADVRRCHGQVSAFFNDLGQSPSDIAAFLADPDNAAVVAQVTVFTGGVLPEDAGVGTYNRFVKQLCSNNSTAVLDLMDDVAVLFGWANPA